MSQDGPGPVIHVAEGLRAAGAPGGHGWQARACVRIIARPPFDFARQNELGLWYKAGRRWPCTQEPT